MLTERVKSWHKRWEAQGIQKGHREVAINLLADTDLDDATIARVSGLRLEAVQALRKERKGGR